MQESKNIKILEKSRYLLAPVDRYFDFNFPILLDACWGNKSYE